MTEEERKKLANENLQRLQTSIGDRSEKRGFRGFTRDEELQEARYQLESEGVDFGGMNSKKGAMAVNERAIANREARGPMAFSTAEGRLISMRQASEPFKSPQAVSPLTQTPSLRFPETAGVPVGMGFGIGARPTATTATSPNISTPFGTVSSSTGMTQAAFEMSNAGLNRASSQRTPEQQQALLAQMMESGEAIRQKLAQDSTNRYYAFRQGLEERRAQEMLTPLAYDGFQVGRARREAAGQALVGAERWKQAASGARGAMDTSPISAFGGEFRQGSMGQFSPIQKPTYTQGISGVQNMFAPAAQATPATMLPAMNETRQNATQLGTSGTPFSFTPFSSNLQTLNEPFRGLAFATQPQRRDTRFTPLPFGLRKQTI